MADTNAITYFLDGEHLLAAPQPPSITITGTDNAPLVTIHPDGTLDYGPDYTPDAAAHAFWEAMRRYTVVPCEQCGHLPGRVLT
jgi:hypothetical protein